MTWTPFHKCRIGDLVELYSERPRRRVLCIICEFFTRDDGNFDMYVFNLDLKEFKMYPVGHSHLLNVASHYEDAVG